MNIAKINSKMSPEKNLKQKAASSMIWTAIQKYSTMVIQLVSGIILARLLTPYDYGCIGMLSIFMVLAEAFIDGGFGSALIQKKNPSQTDYSTIFYWNCIMALLMYSVLFFSAPVVASFYHIPELCSVLRVEGVVLFIYALNVIQHNQLKKKLSFKLLSMISLVTALISLIVTIIMAYLGFGVWSLVTQNIILSAIPCAFFWFYVKWRPMLVFSWKSFKELFSFGFYMFLTNLLNRFSNQIQGLLIGRWYTPAMLGYYSKAAGTEKLASTSISQVVSQVSYPIYATIQDNKEQLISVLKRLSGTLCYLTTPLLLICCLCAEPIFLLLYSDRWLESVPYFQILCLAGIPYALQSVNNQTIAAVGKSKAMFSWTLIKRLVSLLLKVGGLLAFGIYGLLWGSVVSTWFAYFVNISLVSKYIGYGNFQQIKDLFPIFLTSAIAYIVSYFGVGFLNFNVYIDGMLKAMVFVSIYIGWSVVFKPQSFTYTLTLIPSKFKFWSRSN